MVDSVQFGRGRTPREEVDPATDGGAGAQRRDQQSQLRRTLRATFPDRSRSNLLPVLHLLQHEHGHLPEWALQVVGWHLRVPASEVYGAATSYSELRLDAPAEREITVCTGLACWQAGGDSLLDAAQRATASNGDASVSTTPCAFMCGLAPAVRLDQRWRGRVDVDQLAALLAE